MWAWIPEDSPGTFWIGPVVTIAVSIILNIAGQYMTTKISFDMLEFCNPEMIKEAAKHNWTNIGVTAALVLTLIAAMLQTSNLQPVGFQLEDDVLVGLQQTYITCLTISFLMILMCIIHCVLYMSYVEPLKNEDAIKFFIKFPDTLGDPTTFLAIGCMMCYLAFTVWVFLVYGFLQGVFFSVGFLIFTIVCLCQWYMKSAFNPETIQLDWALQDPSTWGHLKQHIPYQYFVHRKDHKIQALVSRLGRASQGGSSNKTFI